MAKRLERLTSAQEAQLPQIRDKWLAIGLSTERADRARAEQGVRLAYRRAGLEEPTILIWLESPMAGAIGAACLHAILQRTSSGERGAQVRAQVVDQVRDQVRAQVVAQVRAQVRAQVWDQVRAQVGATGFGQHDASWLGWLDAFRQFGLADVVARTDGLAMIAEHSGWFWPFRGACILTERHSELRRDARGRLHATDAAAVKYPDGWAIYAWHGVRVGEAVILRPESITVAEIHAEQNAEVRRVLLERFGFDRYIAESGALPIHADETGTLYRCEFPDDEPLVIVRVRNSTPEPDGSCAHYTLRVPPDMTMARQAVAWTFGKDAATYQPAVET